MDDNANLGFFSNDATVLDYARAAVGIGLWESEKKIITQAIPREAKILELGAGAGRVSLALSKLGYKNLTITDFSPAMVQIAENIFADFAGTLTGTLDKTSTETRFQIEDATALTFPDSSFDAAIFAFNGLQMIPKRSRRKLAIAEICRVLKPGGILVFTGHDRTHPLRKKYWDTEKIKWENKTRQKELDEFGDSFYATPHGNVFIHAAVPAEVQAALEAAGFSVEFSELRSRICEESPSVLEFSDDTRFWVARKSVPAANYFGFESSVPAAHDLNRNFN